MKLDWLRFTLPRDLLPSVENLFGVFFGKSKRCKGRYFFDNGLEFAGGAFVFYSDERLCAELSASTLDLLSLDQLQSLCEFFAERNARCTRIDIAIDIVGEKLDFIDAMLRSLERGELVRARVYEPRRKVSGGVEIGRGVTIGSRGELGSGRYVRTYDKGLEQECCGPREWERYEVEFSADTAAEVFSRVSGEGLSAEVMFRLAVGAIDFRAVVPGESAIARRPRVEFWRNFVEGFEPIRLVPERKPKRFHKWVEWFTRCVAPTVETMLAYGDVALDEWWREISGELGARASDQMRSVVWDYCRWKQSGEVDFGVDGHFVCVI